MFIFLGQYYHVLTSTSLVVVSSRTEDYDARPVPAAGKKIVGFRSANMYVVPAYSNTRMNIHLYQDTSIKNYLLQGKLKNVQSRDLFWIPTITVVIIVIVIFVS